MTWRPENRSFWRWNSFIHMSLLGSRGVQLRRGVCLRHPSSSLGVLTLSPFVSTGDECGLCQWDPGDEHDSHGRARLHALHPHRGEKQGRCAGVPHLLSTGRVRALLYLGNWIGCIKDILACLTKVFTFLKNRYVHMVFKKNQKIQFHLTSFY